MNASSEEPSDRAAELRLKELRVELGKGQRHLELLDEQRQHVHDTLLRISGAIQVLEELLHQPAEPPPDIALPNGRRTLAELVAS